MYKTIILLVLTYSSEQEELQTSSFEPSEKLLAHYRKVADFIAEVHQRYHDNLVVKEARLMMMIHSDPIAYGTVT